MSTSRSGFVVAVLGVAALFMPTAVSPQALPEPERFATVYVEAVQRQDYDGMATLTHEDDLGRFRESIRRIVAADTEGEWVATLEVADSAELIGLSARDVYVRFLRATMAGDAEGDEFFDSMVVTILGRLPSPDPEIVVVRYTMSFEIEGAPPPMEGSVRMKRQGDEWRVLLDTGILDWLESLALPG
jgi:hypothetical protein